MHIMSLDLTFVSSSQFTAGASSLTLHILVACFRVSLACVALTCTYTSTGSHHILTSTSAKLITITITVQDHIPHAHQASRGAEDGGCDDGSRFVVLMPSEGSCGGHASACGANAFAAAVAACCPPQPQLAA